MEAMQTETETPVPVLDGAMRMLLLPDVAVKLAVGWKAVRVQDGVTVFGGKGDSVVMNEADFRISLKTAQRITASGLSLIAPGDVIEACAMARRMIAEEVFAPGAVKVLYYPARTQASAFYRCLLPSLVVNRGDKVKAFVSKALSAREAIDYDVVVIQIDHSPASYQFASVLKGMGKKIVFEIDDAFDQLEPWHPRYELYRREDVRARVFGMMELADMVTVPTGYLAERYASRAKRIEVVVNMVALGDWPRAKPNVTGQFRILWAGSPSHAGDLAVAKGALVRLHRKHPEFRFVFFGYAPDWIGELEGAAETHDFVAFDEYPVRYADLAADVAIAPLADIPFNRGKSAIRLLEAGASGYPVVASKVGEYAKVGNAMIPLCTTENDWTNAIESLYLNENFRSLVRENALQIARLFDTENAVNRSDVERFFTDLVGR
jgi:glycosyltransferase involved in cell wall biosynthesis